jgi:predicted nuclease of predicted toxin-antitoxin system
VRFLLDESVNFPAAAFLQQLGHDVTAIAREYPHGLADREVLALAHREQRILLTNDRGFGDLVFREALPHAGIILSLLDQENRSVKLAWLEYVLAWHAEDLTHFVVVTEHGVRVRSTGRD